MYLAMPMENGEWDKDRAKNLSPRRLLRRLGSSYAEELAAKHFGTDETGIVELPPSAPSGR